MPPFAGTSNLPQNLATYWPAGPLSSLEGTRMRGTYTLKVWDNGAATTSTLVQWGLLIKALKLKPPTVEVD